MAKKIDIVNQKFNHLTVLEDIGGGKVICQCDCEDKTILECYKKNVRSGKQKSCGCASGKRKLGPIKGLRFANWLVLEDLDKGKVLCECQCENRTTRELYKKAVINGQTKSCGCLRNEYCNETKKETGSIVTKYKDKKFGEWTVLYRVTNTMKLMCKCSCGTERPVYIQHLMSGESKSCGHNRFNDLTGQQFNNWIVLEDVGGRKVKVQCQCKDKTVRLVYKSSILNGKSKSCGCMRHELTLNTMMEKYGDICTLKVTQPREDWQIKILTDKELLKEYIENLRSASEDNLVTINDLVNALGVNKSSILRTLNQFGLRDYVDRCTGTSYMEKELQDFIMNNCNNRVILNDRTVLSDNQELDIYIPELKLAIEFNGTYWHSDSFKDKLYHRNKSMMCKKNSIRLIHIFEYEWVNNKDTIQKFLLSLLNDKKTVINARNCTITELSNTETIEFLSNNHLQGHINAETNICLKYNEEVVGIMSFGKSRFNSEYQCELLRLCFKHGVVINGGAEKILKYFIKKYNVHSIVSYCNISKFTGKVYSRLGFKLIDVTEPNYVWVKHNNEVFSRYKTQKHKLLSDGLGEYGNTEDEIMRNMNCLKVYDCGNFKFLWIKE